jgi:hyperosmotically inducible protein
MPALKKLVTILFAMAALAGAATVQAQSDSTASAGAASRKTIRKQNHQLESKVRHALTKTKNLDSSSITILARSGKVTLEGQAPNKDQIELAGKTATSVPGVTSVTNNVEVHETGN